MSVSVP